jgi:hypothetical protein
VRLKVSGLFVPMMLLFCWGVGRYELDATLRYSLAAAGSMLLAGISAFFTMMDGLLIPELAFAALVGAPIVGCAVAAASHAHAQRGRAASAGTDPCHDGERRGDTQRS